MADTNRTNMSCNERTLPSGLLVLFMTSSSRCDVILWVCALILRTAKRVCVCVCTPHAQTDTHTHTTHEVCRESIRPFWISREPVASPWCHLAASQRRPYCASANSHSPGGLASRQWDAVDWACALTVAFTMTEQADQFNHDNAPAHSTALVQASFGKASHHPALLAPLQPIFGCLRLLAFPKAKIAIES